jgi:5-methylcytosine-specific restriction endonuclease McrA
METSTKDLPFDLPPSKTCPGCTSEKPASDFYVVKRSGTSRLGYYCKLCTKERAVAWQKANPERKAAADKKQAQRPERKAKQQQLASAWAKEHPEKMREYGAKYRETHREELREKAAGLYAKDHRVRENQRAYHSKEEWKEEHAARERLRRATFSGIHPTFNAKHWSAVLQAFGNACAYCSRSDVALALEHVTPLSDGGDHAPGNVVPSCRSCNSAKGRSSPEAFCTRRGLDLLALRVRALVAV